jgi:Integrase zinc binding domain
LLKHDKGEELPVEVMVHGRVIRKQLRLYVGTHKGWRERMIQTLHDSNVGGHSDILGTYHRVKKLFYCPNLKMDVLNWVQACDICQLNKEEHIPSLELLEPIPIPEEV